MALNNSLEAMKMFRDEKVNRHLANVPEELRQAEREKLEAMSELELIFSLGLSIGVVNQEAAERVVQTGQFVEDIGSRVIVVPPEPAQHVEVEGDQVSQGDTGVEGLNGTANGASGLQTDQPGQQLLHQAQVHQQQTLQDQVTAQQQQQLYVQQANLA